MFCLAQIKQLEDLKEVLYLRTLHLSSIIILFKVHPEIAKRALLVVRRHLEVLAGPLVILSLAKFNNFCVKFHKSTFWVLILAAGALLGPYFTKNGSQLGPWGSLLV